jgi:hypothetical protein
MKNESCMEKESAYPDLINLYYLQFSLPIRHRNQQGITKPDPECLADR